MAEEQPPKSPATVHQGAEATIDGRFTFGRTEINDISVLPQRLMRRPHLFQIVAGELAPKNITLSDQPVVIGRGSECGIRLLSSDLSRRHARLERTRRGFQITDLESRNGIYVNEVRIESAILRDGDTVQLGNLQLLYHEGS